MKNASIGNHIPHQHFFASKKWQNFKHCEEDMMICTQFVGKQSLKRLYILIFLFLHDNPKLAKKVCKLQFAWCGHFPYAPTN